MWSFSCSVCSSSADTLWASDSQSSTPWLLMWHTCRRIYNMQNITCCAWQKHHQSSYAIMFVLFNYSKPVYSYEILPTDQQPTYLELYLMVFILQISMHLVCGSLQCRHCCLDFASARQLQTGRAQRVILACRRRTTTRLLYSKKFAKIIQSFRK